MVLAFEVLPFGPFVFGVPAFGDFASEASGFGVLWLEAILAFALPLALTLVWPRVLENTTSFSLFFGGSSVDISSWHGVKEARFRPESLSGRVSCLLLSIIVEPDRTLAGGSAVGLCASASHDQSSMSDCLQNLQRFIAARSLSLSSVYANWRNGTLGLCKKHSGTTLEEQGLNEGRKGWLYATFWLHMGPHWECRWVGWLDGGTASMAGATWESSWTERARTSNLQQD